MVEYYTFYTIQTINTFDFLALSTYTLPTFLICSKMLSPKVIQQLYM